MKRYSEELKKIKVIDTLEMVISGEWGEENTEDNENTAYIIRTTNFLNNGTLDIENRELVKRQISKEKIDEKHLKKGDIIIEKSGGSPNQPVGRVVYFDIETEKNFLCNNFTSILRVREGIEPKYIFYFLKSCYNKRVVLKYQNKTTGIINLKLSDYLKNTEIHLPNIETQRKIVSILDKVFLINSLVSEKEKYFSQLSKCLFEGEFLNRDYDKHSLSECTIFIDYRGRTPKISPKGTIQMINAKSVGKNYFKYTDEFITEEIYNLYMTRGVGKTGDILFVTEGHTFGNVCMVPENLKKFALGQRVITIRGKKEKVLNKYLCYYMQTEEFKKDINKYKTGGTAQGIRSKDLEKIMIPIPDLKFQIKFEKRISVIEKSKVEVQKSIEETQKLFDSLMEKYFG